MKKEKLKKIAGGAAKVAGGAAKAAVPVVLIVVARALAGGKIDPKGIALDLIEDIARAAKAKRAEAAR